MHIDLLEISYISRNYLMHNVLYYMLMDAFVGPSDLLTLQVL